MFGLSFEHRSGQAEGRQAGESRDLPWMSKHVDLLEPRWDHRNPKNEVMEGGFGDYVKLLQVVGSWGGFLELYAASTATNLNIMILTADGIVKFAAKNEVGAFVVLKYEACHYELVEIPQQMIAKLWLGANEAKPSGHRGGAEGSVGLALSDFAEDSSAKGGLALSAFKQSSATGKKKLELAAATRLPSSSSKAIEVDADDELNPEDFEPTRSKGWLYRHRQSQYLPSEGLFEWQCDLCPFTASKATAGKCANARTMHVKLHHPQSFKTDRYQKPTVQVLRLGEDAVWRCPMDGCRFGIPKELLHVGNDKIHQQARSTSEGMPSPRRKKTWRLKLATHARSDHARKHRVTMLNLGAAKRFGTELVDDQWEHFTRPQITRKPKLGQRFGLRKAWRCKYCLSTTLSAAEVRSHLCHVVSEAFIAKAVTALERHHSTTLRLLRKGSSCTEGFSEQQLHYLTTRLLQLLREISCVLWMISVAVSDKDPLIKGGQVLSAG